MKIFDQFGNELNGADLDLERGKLVQTNRIKPDAKPIDDIEKFAYEDDDYEDILEYIVPDEAEWLERQIDKFKRNLTDTDYCILKVMEGAATLADYAQVITERKSWREKINELEAQLSALQKGSES